jgi:very-short-patch-repair endonuclease
VGVAFLERTQSASRYSHSPDSAHAAPQPNPAEKKLWNSLRGKQLEGFHFRRQFPIGAFSVDFCCRDRRLVIELDGSQHANPTGIAEDNERTALISMRGYRVMRFWNEEVLTNLEGVVEAILIELRQPHLTSPWSGGGIESPYSTIVRRRNAFILLLGE